MYMLAIYGDASSWGTQREDEAKAELDAFAAFEREAAEAGILAGSTALEPEAHTLTSRDGAPATSEGGVTEAGRRLGCFYLIDCEALADAQQWASRIPLVGPGGFHSIEIRRVVE